MSSEADLRAAEQRARWDLDNAAGNVAFRALYALDNGLDANLYLGDAVAQYKAADAAYEVAYAAWYASVRHDLDQGG